MTAVIEIEDLRKEYQRLRGGATIAVAGLDLTASAGGVFGVPETLHPKRLATYHQTRR